MKAIKLRDNRFGKSARFALVGADGGFVLAADETEGLDALEIDEPERKLLQAFGGKKLEELAGKASGGLVLLDGTHVSASSRMSQSFFTFNGEKDGGPFSLETGNLMGVLRLHGKASGASVQVEVLSRFDKGEKNYFLNYLLSKAFDCALGAESVSAERSSLLEILLDIVFVRRLGEAVKAGLLRHYREFRNNDWNFKGSLDLARHIRENVPLMHGIAYRKREIDLDVPVNRMILKAALTVNRRHPAFFEDYPDAADALRQLRMGVTEEHDLRTLLSRRDCREPVRHPFYREIWEPLRRIARMILEDEHWTLFTNETTDEDEVSGIVFDGSWLWEEYIAKVLKTDFLHCGRGESADGQGLRVFVDGYARFYPDFLKKDRSCVLDAKYKRSNPNGDRDDVHQVLCYLLLTGAKFGGLVFPPEDRCEKEEDRDEETYGGTGGGWSSPREIASPYSKDPGPPIRWSCYSWVKPQSDTWEAFKRSMTEQEEKLRVLP